MTEFCFGAGCTTWSTTATSGDLRFSGGNFSISINEPGADTVTGLGQFTKLGDSVADSTFRLRLNFADGPTVVTSDIAIYVVSVDATGSSGKISEITFGAPQSFTYVNGSQSGTFTLGIAPLGSYDRGAYTPTNLTGSITDATLVTSTPPIVASEPASLMLLGSGLLFAGARLRRNKKP